MLLSLWDLSFLTRDWTQDLEVKALSNNNHWVTKESSLYSHCLSFFFFLFLWLCNCKYLVVTFPDLFIHLFIFCLVGSAVELNASIKSSIQLLCPSDPKFLFGSFLYLPFSILILSMHCFLDLTDHLCDRCFVFLEVIHISLFPQYLFL